MVDAELIRSAQNGDRKALVQLLESIEHSVYRTAFYILGNEHDALDASQEALIRIYTKIDTYQEKAKFSTWVQRIVTNICIDKFRKKKETVSIDQHELTLYDSHDVEREIERAGVAEEVREAIKRLPEHQRTVVTLRYLQDLSYGEIAEVMDMPLNTVKSYLYRARQHLQELLHEYQKGGV
ncbi:MULTISPECIES: RNA polymerase sigma factor [Aneurinibacillus]|uniref:RNA polymerase sigma-70 factor, ECF subfamily n=1 Tax=Aneurinibacillus thermoaerophilus TaxID=143495 RepID=A0A1G7Z781_ANETH|nr:MULTISPECIES: sigma-70 family RNA polymerase sigma factor [Aneurinibacillus]AMA72316.1 RNA polymerase subunit sigma [Aneurinibacillus sp. XH2]MED0674833.1 sigma-70 family RNA polymerase sigma factor [Aneurinibacillus thermoaerophilus]MED0679783.1 sigma-70 family RNA polymerase sigma factor [Aneurinibacillus thermoaerophilus]MED0735815.1 sigma-70 family RNA polymerase sigma factor [Aneurinibacillus thermoaerophilus]MED0758515.1 sigma-70 family RNA polymerase sigma factor [Aneurinibacillus th